MYKLGDPSGNWCALWWGAKEECTAMQERLGSSDSQSLGDSFKQHYS